MEQREVKLLIDENKVIGIGCCVEKRWEECARKLEEKEKNIG